MVHVIGIVGLIGSGKDTAAEYLSKNYGCSIISFRDVVAAMMKRKGIKTTRENMQKFSRKMRNSRGEDIFAKEVVKKIRQSKSKKIVVKEMRTEGDLLTIKQRFGKYFFVIEIFADEKTRFERLKGRKRIGDPKNFKEFLRQQRREKDLGYTKSLKYADYRLENSGALDELHKKLDTLMRKVK